MTPSSAAIWLADLSVLYHILLPALIICCPADPYSLSASNVGRSDSRQTSIAAVSHIPIASCWSLQDFTKDERAVLAGKARVQAPVFGSPERQAVTDEVHAEMLKREAQVLLLLIDSREHAGCGTATFGPCCHASTELSADVI